MNANALMGNCSNGFRYLIKLNLKKKTKMQIKNKKIGNSNSTQVH